MRLLSSKLFMRGVSLLLLFAYSVSAFAQGEKDPNFMSERRIFLWDVTISMVGATNEAPDKVAASPRKNPDFDYKGWMYSKSRDIFDATRAKLCNLIDDIDGLDCEIVVVPYTTDIQPAFHVPSSSPQDKERIKKMIMEWDNLKAGGTYTGQCLEKVMNTYFTKDKVNRVILLTDGRPSSEDGNKLYDIVDAWDCTKRNTKYENNRLVYVMLNDQAADSRIEDILEDKDNEEGVGALYPGQDIEQLVTFRLSNTNVRIYVNEYVSEGSLAAGGVMEFGTKLIQGSGVDGIECKFTCEGNDYISVSSAPVSPNENGTYVVPFAFAGPDREYYRSALVDGTDDVKMQFEVVSADNKIVTLEGTNKINVEIIVKDEPRATISLSKK